MLDLSDYSTDDLELELERRTKESAPKMRKWPDYADLQHSCQAYIDAIATGTYHEDDDDQHYIFEAALEALYGKDIWDWIQEQL